LSYWSLLRCTCGGEGPSVIAPDPEGFSGSVASEDARFGLPEVTRGLVAAAGGLYRLPRAVPRNLAAEIVLTGEPFPAELLLRLKHMILSHHGTHEFGSPRLPMTPEAIALHCLDNFDAKVHSFTRDIRDDRNAASSWTPYNPSLQRRLFKGTMEGSEPVYSPTLEGPE